jgi:phosphoribosylformimino-5-aminoimidazole carboxamide ribotide isomerase
VNLSGGDFDKSVALSDDPLKLALKWEAQGAKAIHVVDSDGVRQGEPKNMQVVKEMIDVLEIPIQFGGGVRSIDTAHKLVDMGVNSIVFGSAAITNADLLRQAVNEFGDKLVVSLDQRHGKVVIDGWRQITDKSVIGLAQELEDLGVKTIIVTDIMRVGTLDGFDVVGIQELLAKVFYIKVFAAGGIAAVHDIKRLRRLGAHGAIIGKALYTGDINLIEAMSV